MKYLHYFETESEYNQARDNNYEEPWVSYTEGEGLDYNKDYNKEYLTLKVLTSGVVDVTNYDWYEDENTVNPELYYSKNGGEWTNMVFADETNKKYSISVVSGDSIRLKGTGSEMGWPYMSITSTAQFNAEGNVMSLLENDDFDNVYEINCDCALMGLFQECTGLISAKNLKLPATTISYACYGLNDSDAWNGMFRNCTNLVEGPEELPATIAPESCYCHMFDGCENMVSGPRILAEEMGYYSCLLMFAGCSSMTDAPELNAMVLGTGCYSEMFSGCTSLVNVQEILPATTLTPGCYRSMFLGCTSLETAPVLPATELLTNSWSDCYRNMFNGCSSLNYVKAMFISIPENNSAGNTNGWLYGVSATGTFVKNSAAQWDVTGANGIPSGWTVQIATS